MKQEFLAEEPVRAAIDALQGPALIEFGSPTCGHCQAMWPALERALAGHPDIAHYRIEDGRGRPLGRSFGVKLWPTLVFMRNGAEVARLVRPLETEEIGAALARIDPVAAKPNSTCPLCGAPNECAPARSGTHDTPCWCWNITIDPAILAKIPPEARNEACLCRRCATGETSNGS